MIQSLPSPVFIFVPSLCLLWSLCFLGSLRLSSIHLFLRLSLSLPSRYSLSLSFVFSSTCSLLLSLLSALCSLSLVIFSGRKRRGQWRDAGHCPIRPSPDLFRRQVHRSGQQAGSLPCLGAEIEDTQTDTHTHSNREREREREKRSHTPTRMSERERERERENA